MLCRRVALAQPEVRETVLLCAPPSSSAVTVAGGAGSVRSSVIGKIVGMNTRVPGAVGAVMAAGTEGGRLPCLRRRPVLIHGIYAPDGADVIVVVAGDTGTPGGSGDRLGHRYGRRCDRTAGDRQSEFVGSCNDRGKGGIGGAHWLCKGLGRTRGLCPGIAVFPVLADPFRVTLLLGTTVWGTPALATGWLRTCR